MQHVPASICYFSGELIPTQSASLPILDRAVLFGEGVYEVIPLFCGRPFHLDRHWLRLQNSCRSLGLTNAFSTEKHLADTIDSLVTANDFTSDGSIYLQITGGALATRNLEQRASKPNSFMLLQYSDMEYLQALPAGKKLKLIPDIRWQMGDIKATSLIGAAYLRRQAQEQGYHDALLHRSDVLTEATSSNIFCVDNAGAVTTPLLSQELLAGTTRSWMIDLLGSMDIVVTEKDLTVTQLFESREVFLTSALSGVVPVSAVDNHEFTATETIERLWCTVVKDVQRFKATTN